MLKLGNLPKYCSPNFPAISFAPYPVHKSNVFNVPFNSDIYTSVSNVFNLPM